MSHGARREVEAGAHKDVLILGVGNVLCGDDGLGLRVAEMLAHRSLPPGVRVEAAGLPGWGLGAWLEGWAKVILVDAARLGLKPGEWKRFGPDEVRLLAAERTISLHQAGLADGLRLAQALDLLPREIVFYGVEPACCEPGEALSSSVRRAVSEVVEAIRTETWKRGE
jgi:hydrogenase maturation protease